MADQTENGNVITQRFSGGVISWDRSKNSFSTEPANLASQLAGLQVPGQDVPKSPAPNSQASDTNIKKWFAWSWWWLLAIIPVLVLAGLVAVATMRTRRQGRDDDIFDTGEHEFATYDTSDSADDDAAELFSGRYAGQGLGSPPSTSGGRDYPEPPLSLWGAPSRADETDTTREPAATPETVGAQEEQDDPDAVDTTPTRVPTSVERDPLTDTGRHARIEIDDSPNGTALHLPLDDPDEVPQGYQIKADTKSGLYWAPGSSLYDDASAEIWFASEEIARTNGFVRAN
jgi:uncharacterized protein with LGFP repeats